MGSGCSAFVVVDKYLQRRATANSQAMAGPFWRHERWLLQRLAHDGMIPLRIDTALTSPAWS